MDELFKARRERREPFLKDTLRTLTGFDFRKMKGLWATFIPSFTCYTMTLDYLFTENSFKL